MWDALFALMVDADAVREAGTAEHEAGDELAGGGGVNGDVAALDCASARDGEGEVVARDFDAEVSEGVKDSG